MNKDFPIEIIYLILSMLAIITFTAWFEKHFEIQETFANKCEEVGDEWELRTNSKGVEYCKNLFTGDAMGVPND